MTIVAKRVREIEKKPKNPWVLWELSEEIEPGDGLRTRFVVSSAQDVPFSGPETYIFPCDEAGEILEWCELEGSFQGGLDHEAAIEGAGWEIAGD